MHESFSETMVEDTDSASAFTGHDTLTPEQFQHLGEVIPPPTLEEVRATKRFFIWTGVLLFGVAMLIHAIITQWPEYIVLASVSVPIALWGFFVAKRRWQKHRSFGAALMRSLGTDHR